MKRVSEWGLWCLATAALFHRVLLGGAVVVGRDALRVSIPLFEHWTERVRAGGFPDWYPADAFGQSFVGMMVSAPFHPAHVLGLVMPAWWAVTVATLAAYPVAASGAAALARRLGVEARGALLAGAAFGFCGYLVSMHDSLGYLLCAATAPWALAWLDRFLDDGARRSLFAAAGAWALCLFAGDAQGFVTVGRGLGALAWWRRRWLRAVWAAGVTALLGAPQWLPAALVGQDTARGALSRAEVELWSTHPLRLLELIAGPLFFAQPGTDLGKALARDVLSSGLPTLWAASLAVAPVATVFAVLALHHHRRERGARLLAGVAVLCLWLALGKHLGASRVLGLLPFRYPEKWMPWVTLCLALGAAHGVTLDARRWLRGLGALVAVAAGLVAWRSPSLFGELAWSALLISAVTLIIAGVGRLERPWGLAALALLAVVPASRVLQLAPPSVLDPTRGFAAKVGGARAYRLMGKLDGAAGEPGRLTTALVDVLDPVARGVELGNTYLPARTAHVDTLVESPQWLSQRLTRLGSVRYLSVSQPDLARVPPLPTVATSERWKVSLLEDEGALPRAYLALPVCAEKPALFMVAHPSFEPSRQVLLPCAPMARPPEARGVVEPSADLRHFRTRADGPMVLVVTDAFARGWSYELDGQPVAMERGNLAFQAVRVPAGEHEVTRRYRTPGLGWAGLLFLLGLLAPWAFRRGRPTA